MICHTTGCPTANEFDQYERRMSVEIDNRTQCGLSATGHHLINRVYDGTIREHIAGWSNEQIARAYAEADRERERAKRYVETLDDLAAALGQTFRA